jgi:glycosyltransferase involved in cell wall biosynthesis
MASGISLSEPCIAAFDRIWEARWSRNPLDLRNVLQSPQVRAVISENRYDIVHVHTPVAGFVVRLALRRVPSSRRPRVVYTAHGFHFHPRGRRWRNAAFLTLERIADRWTDDLIVINREDLDAARRYGLAAHGRLHYIPGIGVDVPELRTRCSPGDRLRMRRNLGLEPGDHLFAMVAELNTEKRHLDALLALKMLSRPTVHIAFAGTGPLRDALERRARRLGVDARVHWLGFTRDVPALLGASAGILLPSEREGLSRTILEALALGVPVIGTRIRGIRELIEDERGLLIEVGDVRELARAMEWLIENPSAAEEMSQRARGAVTGYSLDHVLEAHWDLYGASVKVAP